MRECGTRGSEEPIPLVGLEFVSERDGGELGRMENLVGVGVADAADEARIGEGTLEGAVLKSECGAKAVEVRREDFDAAGIDGVEGLFAAQDVERRAALAACLSEDEGAGGEVECGEVLATGQFCLRRPPVETAGNHEVKH